MQNEQFSDNSVEFYGKIHLLKPKAKNNWSNVFWSYHLSSRFSGFFKSSLNSDFWFSSWVLSAESADSAEHSETPPSAILEMTEI